jgi:hypothetical protein
MMIRLACFVSQSSKCKNFRILFREVAASLSAYVQFWGGLMVVNIIISENPFNPKVHTYKATRAPIFALKFEKKIFSH